MEQVTAKSRGSFEPTELLREKFVSHMARQRRNVATMWMHQSSLKGGVCVNHGAKLKRCSHEGCTKQVVKGGVCWTHGAKGR